MRNSSKRSRAASRSARAWSGRPQLRSRRPRHSLVSASSRKDWRCSAERNACSQCCRASSSLPLFAAISESTRCPMARPTRSPESARARARRACRAALSRRPASNSASARCPRQKDRYRLMSRRSSRFTQFSSESITASRRRPRGLPIPLPNLNHAEQAAKRPFQRVPGVVDQRQRLVHLNLSRAEFTAITVRNRAATERVRSTDTERPRASLQRNTAVQKVERGLVLADRRVALPDIDQELGGHTLVVVALGKLQGPRAVVDGRFLRAQGIVYPAAPILGAG